MLNPSLITSRVNVAEQDALPFAETFTVHLLAPEPRVTKPAVLIVAVGLPVIRQSIRLSSSAHYSPLLRSECRVRLT